MQHLSTKAYEYLRCEELLKLPCRTTLQKFFGTTSSEVGFSELFRSRLEAELKSLDTPQSKVCSLVVDEMRIKQNLLYHKQRDAFVGNVDLGSDLEYLAPAAEGIRQVTAAMPNLHLWGRLSEFMEVFHKWFTSMDVSNLQQHIHRNDADARQFSEIDDPRLDWIEGEFVSYIEHLKTKSHAENFLKAMLGFLRRNSGCNDALDVKSAVCGIEKMLKTGVVAFSAKSNVRSSTSLSSTQLLPVHHPPTKTTSTAEKVLEAAIDRLKEQCLSAAPLPSNPDVASVAMAGGFIVTAASENIPCAECIVLLQGTKANTPLLGLIAHQDRGGLMYPSQELVKFLTCLRKFVDSVLPRRKSFSLPLKVCVERSVELLMGLPLLRRGNTDTDHRRRLLHLITAKFIKPLLSHYALGTTDSHATVKLLELKPISRKLLKM
ncbi:hypothetical protein HPB49_012124 [Dermacentor silvarum]|uniref:Uncharacterized protein n=1 Tax=Dermacentor silvarum TaxID=543639 RepID=A0ACB8DCC4_DERSI|nr:hypothetical protein HPB49_012124 [Dermacentor silvarum]